METTINPPLSPADAGCWYDSHRGYERIAREVISDAIRLGMVTEFDPEPTGEEGDILRVLSSDLFDTEEQATDYISNLAPKGFWIGWQDGDFGMWPIDEDESVNEAAERYEQSYLAAEQRDREETC